MSNLDYSSHSKREERAICWGAEGGRGMGSQNGHGCSTSFQLIRKKNAVPKAHFTLVELKKPK